MNLNDHKLRDELRSELKSIGVKSQSDYDDLDDSDIDQICSDHKISRQDLDIFVNEEFKNFTQVFTEDMESCASSLNDQAKSVIKAVKSKSKSMLKHALEELDNAVVDFKNAVSRESKDFSEKNFTNLEYASVFSPNYKYEVGRIIHDLNDDTYWRCKFGKNYPGTESLNKITYENFRKGEAPGGVVYTKSNKSTFDKYKSQETESTKKHKEYWRNLDKEFSMNNFSERVIKLFATKLMPDDKSEQLKQYRFKVKTKTGREGFIDVDDPGVFDHKYKDIVEKKMHKQLPLIKFMYQEGNSDQIFPIEAVSKEAALKKLDSGWNKNKIKILGEFNPTKYRLVRTYQILGDGIDKEVDVDVTDGFSYDDFEKDIIKKYGNGVTLRNINYPYSVRIKLAGDIRKA